MSDTPAILALTYSDSDLADRTLRALANELRRRRWRLAGLVQHNKARPGHSRCDMELEDLASGRPLAVSQDRGPHARGCALDVGQLLTAMECVRSGLGAEIDLVLLNKFGKTEGEGGGLRPLIAEVVEAGLPLLIAVPWRNIESWRNFAGDLSQEHELSQLPGDVDALCELLGFRERSAPATASAGLRV